MDAPRIPRECPFPQVAGAASPTTPDGVMAHHGIDEVGATLEETHWHYSQRDDEDLAEDIPLPGAQGG